ncbi:MAG: aminotransferase class V-fold PLP-dependent enzyme [Geminicoccaceae bacterium]|nr:aminotransferase class V-fold PLP-dependent enzyme [Geminicoccaceae bacterium]MDW8340836.1 aminotransferase class V-fold PLP-dependent enzyme [Geminicoccaceae bacterium]
MRRWTADALRALDAEDPLSAFRDRFLLPRGCVYLNAHTLGPLPGDTPAALARVIEERWGEGLARACERPGEATLLEELAEAIARLVGAAPHEIAVGGSISVDLFELSAAAVDLRPGRSILLSERRSLPTALRAVQGLCELSRGEIELVLVEEDEPLADKLDERVACLVVSHVDDRTGRLVDLQALSAAAHEVGALLLVDLSHSVGAMPIELQACHVDFAVGCGDKYLCGGPGAPSFLFVAERHLERVRLPLRGRVGDAEPFCVESARPPGPGIGRFALASPSLLALEALRCGVAVVAEADLPLVRAKAMRSSEAFRALVGERLAGYGIELASPEDPLARGAHLAFSHPRAEAIASALAEHGVRGDFRRPDLVRFGFGPLWNSYEEVWIAAERFAEVVIERALASGFPPERPERTRS